MSSIVAPRAALLVPLLLTLLATDARAQRAGWAPLADGPFAVGFRVEPSRDHSRTTGPRVDWRGRAVPEVAMPVQVATWYPARDGGRPVRWGDYLLLRARRDGERTVSAADSAEALRGMEGMARFAHRVTLDSAATRARFAQPTRARHAAPARPGRYPVVLALTDGSVSGSAPLWEALASHGYVVLAMSTRRALAGQQAFAPAVVIDERVRDLEVLAARARELPGADASRLAVVGVNFDGMPALLWQLKHMRAAAVASVDGWEGKRGSVATVRASPHWDPRRLRVPYLLLLQHEASVPDGLAHDMAVFDALRWSARRQVVVRDAGHAQLVGAALAYPVDSAVRLASLEAARRVVAFVRRHVPAARPLAAGDTAPLAPALRDVVARAAPPAPTADELEALMAGDDTGEIVRLLREAQAHVPDVPLFTPAAMRLYAFRRARAGRPADALRLVALSAEVHAWSPWVQRDLGDAHLAVADTTRARGAFTRGLELARDTTRVPPADRAGIEAELRRRLEPLAPRADGR